MATPAIQFERRIPLGRSAYLPGSIDFLCTQIARRLRQCVEAALAEKPLLRAQYVSCARLDTLEEWEQQVEGAALLSLAVEAGQTRLIDNRWLGLTAELPDLS